MRKLIRSLSATFLAGIFGLLLAQPVLAYCCLCVPKTGTGSVCLTDTTGSCDDLVSRHVSNLTDIKSCSTIPDTQCQTVSGAKSASAECVQGPMSATSYTAGTASKPGATGVINAPTLNVPIPGLQYSDNIPIVQGQSVPIPFLAQYISAVYNYLLGISVIAAAIMIVYGGFKYIVSSSIQGVKDGKQIINDAIIGLILVFSAYTILAIVSPPTTQLKTLEIPTISTIDFALEHNMDTWGPHPVSLPVDLPIVDGRPVYKPRDWSGKTADYPGPDTDGSCNPVTGSQAFNYKQGGDEWGAQPAGPKRLCSKTAIADDPSNTKNQTEYVFYNSLGHDGGGGSPAPPCCIDYQQSACGATSAAIVLAAYGEPVTPGIIGEMIIRGGGRTCNTGGFSPMFVANSFPSYTFSTKYDRNNIDKDLRSGHPLVFECGGCLTKTVEIVGRTPHPELYSVDKTWPGHFMVLTGVYTDGNYAVANPGNSPTKAPDGKLVQVSDWISKDEVLSKRVTIYDIRPKDGRPIKICSQ